MLSWLWDWVVRKLDLDLHEIFCCCDHDNDEEDL